MRTRFFVGEVVDSVLRGNEPYYNEELTDLIPDKLLNTVFNSKNVWSLSKKIDRLRYKKERELALVIGSSDDHALYKVINCPLNSLSPEVEQKRKEIKFLFNVAATLCHW